MVSFNRDIATLLSKYTDLLHLAMPEVSIVASYSRSLKYCHSVVFFLAMHVVIRHPVNTQQRFHL
jgi:hypothetical protein